ncbi:unnamed protein product [Urochloa decumbens]|uniref:DUF1618 domain-containing protein n=1 Tax=Urochloa decumbens TaxID=240449 RepID=A0ABC9E6J0_9POAL
MAAAAAALPNWVMLERFVFRRDDPNSFREDRRTSAACSTSTGARFDVSFVLAEPHTPSRLYLSWPEGPKDEWVCYLVAAHRDLVLLRLDSLVDESQPFGEVRHEYFIYIADPTSQIPPLLRPLPQCMEHDSDLGRPLTFAFSPRAVGLLCHGEDEFAVAYLGVWWSHVTSEMEAELWVLRSSSSCCRDDGAENWEKQRLPIPYEEDDHLDGILVCDGIFGESPKVAYIRFPVDTFVRDNPRRIRKELYRSLCVTDCGSRLVFVDVARHDGTGLGSMAPGTGFTMTFQTLEMAENDMMQYQWIEDAVVTSDQLWAANTPSRLPREVMIIPLVSMDVPNIVHVVLFGWEIGSFLLVAIDSSDKQVLGSVVTYIESSEQGLSTDDADLVRAKPTSFTHFLPSEFPKFLNLTR